MNLQKYLDQLHIDITTVIKNRTSISIEKNVNAANEGFYQNEGASSFTISLEKWCGIDKKQLPPETALTASQLTKLLDQLKTLLEAYRIYVVFQLLVPENLQYRVIRARFDQKIVYQKDFNKFIFSLCDEPTDRTACPLEEEYCHCIFYENFFKQFSKQEEQNKPLDIRINSDKIYLLKRRYGDDWYQYLRIDEEDFNNDV